MAYFAVGDIQGCYDPLRRGLDACCFDPNKDTLLCVGDLVNRGSQSLEVLRYLKSLNKQCVAVLGNHDIHLIAISGAIRTSRPSDTLQPVLKAHDRDELITWLANNPLLYVNDKRQLIVSHAGIYPWWSLEQAIDYAAEIELRLSKASKRKRLLMKSFGNLPSRWDESLSKHQRRRFIINAFTRMRWVSPKRNLNLTESGYSGRIRKNRQPWFAIDNPGLQGYRIVFGHWSALGLYNKAYYLGLDSGCVWGRGLTIAKLPKSPSKKIKARSVFHVPSVRN